MKLKLDASSRRNNRYLLIDGSEEEIKKAILDYIGILGYAKAAPVFAKEDGKLVLAIERKELNNVRAAFEASNANLKVLRVSGTIKGLNK